MHDLSTLAKLEPWRTGYGKALNALDPTWDINDQVLCTGEQWWEGMSKWWMCTTCGHTSKLSHPMHHPAHNPYMFFIKAVMFYMSKRQEQQVPITLSISQALFTIGVALRYAAVQHPERLGDYVDKMH
jgi:hypothetical protein